MQKSGSSNSTSHILSKAALVCLGGFLGALYCFLFFGLNLWLLWLGFCAGAFIISIYILLEFYIFKGNFKNESLGWQYFLRFIAYFLLFDAGFLSLSCLHATYSAKLYDVLFLEVYSEDYQPFVPAFLLYAALASAIFQSFWLFQSLVEKQMETTFSTFTYAAVLVIGYRENASFTASEKEEIFQIITREFSLAEADFISNIENSLLKLCFTNPKKNEMRKAFWEHKLHMCLGEKMLQLQCGFADGDVEISVNNGRKTIEGSALKMAANDFLNQKQKIEDDILPSKGLKYLYNS